MEGLPPKPAQRGRRRETDLREVINALRYPGALGGGRRMQPKGFPARQTVCWWFRQLMRRFLFQTLHDVVLMLDRELEGKQRLPKRGRGESASGKRAWLRRGKEARWVQAAYCPGCEWTVADGELDACGHRQ